MILIEKLGKRGSVDANQLYDSVCVISYSASYGQCRRESTLRTIFVAIPYCDSHREAGKRGSDDTNQLYDFVCVISYCVS